ncbi:MAG: SDR family NAD(P)-dependent oxidoreductase [Planctomycetota bacterium]
MPTRWNPAGAVTIVTGASSGIGRELSILLCEHGATVLAVARRQDRLEALAAIAGKSLIPVVGDVTQKSVRQSTFARIDHSYDGRLDLLVNNAGAGAIGRFETADPERARKLMELNYFAPLDWTRDALVPMRTTQSRLGIDPMICNMGSVLGHRGVPEKSEYCASKFAIHGFSDSLRAELASDRIGVTLVSPSRTESEFFESLVDSDKDAKSIHLGAWTAKRVARATLAAIQSRRSEVILSMGGKALVYADRLVPPVINAVMARLPSGSQDP